MWLKYWSPPPACSVYLSQPLLTSCSRFFKFWTSSQISSFISLSLSFFLISFLLCPYTPACPLSLPHILSIIAAFLGLRDRSLYCVPRLSHPPYILSIDSLAAACFVLSVHISPPPSLFFSPPVCASVAPSLSPSFSPPPSHLCVSLSIAPSLAVCSSMKLKRSKLLFNQSLFGKVLRRQKLSIPSAASVYACMYCLCVCVCVW